MTRLLLATADPDFEARVRGAFGDEDAGVTTFWHDGMPFGDDLDRTLAGLGDAEVVALGPDLPDQTAIALARSVDRSRPDVSVVMFAEASTEMMREALRAGARDVLDPRASYEEIRDALALAFDAAETRRTAFEGDRETEADAPRVITVICPKGGAGKTTVATNLASGLAQGAPNDVVIVDLDLQFGDVASALHIEPEHTFADVVRAFDGLDPATLKAFLSPHPGNLFALCAPLSPTDADEVTSEHVGRVIEMLSASFKYVVVDTAAGLDEACLSALEYATDFVVLSATDVPCVRNTRKEVEALRLLSRPDQRWHFVLNRADARTGLNISAIEKAVGLTLDVAIPSSRTVPVSLNQGTPLVVAEPRKPVSLAMAQIVRRVAPELSGEAASNGARRRKNA
ncbi:MAG TPA: AAA family ATPase [Acidimicrobiia bacterium]|nr:AAA family ATPase [Acidimicrobiia bacterium]